ncbi:FkbM family methyltransferase [Aliirhizobium smilacinae]|uniref:FkbM family methyltransferase n=1 Tax=Aliirhizobium smilacinae TaxID=1395944 RepID=A0A5C4XRR1_9HYPH|nr:FkbM family methyltransferase [Rhizobium smilacinae]TNM66155.1 FkbM family methyltransferase [Rhizobium smilacinae]
MSIHSPGSSEIVEFEYRFAQFYAENYAFSSSQLGQDMLALFVVGPRSGTFLDIGAADPLSISNTICLERSGWRGVLVEPNPTYAASIRRQRNAILVNKAVTPRETGFAELDLVADNPEFSRLDGFSLSDVHDARGKRLHIEKTLVETISICDLIELYKSSLSEIDFVSLDIEGLELPILEHFPYSELEPAIICVEHNYSDAEKKIEVLLQGRGYQRVCRDVSKWDAWFIHEDVLKDLNMARKPIAQGAIVSSELRGINYPEVAKLLFDRGNFPLATAFLKNVERDHELMASAQLILARAHLRQCDFARSLEVCDEALKLGADRPERDTFLATLRIIQQMARAKLNRAERAKLNGPR